jgi:hypothetical protein
VGTFTDLSIHGCYIEMTATFPVGAMVDLVLTLEGQRANVKGEVRVSYPFLGIGIAFREISPESQRTLQSMVASLLAQQRVASSASSESPTPIPAPVIVHPAAAFEAVADFFQTHSILSKNEFLQLVSRSQTRVR